MQVNSNYNTYYLQRNFSANNTSESKTDDETLTYKEILEQNWEDYMNGEIEQDVFYRMEAASFTAALVEAYKKGIHENPFSGMKRVQQERLKADTPSEIAVEINKDISALNNNFNAAPPGMTFEENQRLNNKAKDVLFEILQEIKA